MPGETLQTYAVQSRLFALSKRRVLVGATSGRLIAIFRGLIGGFRVVDVRWQDLKDVRLDVGIFGADLTLLGRLRRRRRSQALLVHYKNRLVGNGARGVLF